MTHLATTFRLATYRLGPIRRPIIALLAVAAIVSAGVRPVPAQQGTPKDAAPSAAASKTPTEAKEPVQYVGPDTYILLDAKGRPQPLPGMTYEDFLAAWKKMNEAANPESKPRFAIENIKIDGQKTGERAELSFNIMVRVLSPGQVNVPLGLVGAILQGEAQFGKADSKESGAGTAANKQNVQPTSEYLDFDPQRGGYVAHLTGAEGERRTISLKMIAPLQRDGAETSLALNLPRATSASLALATDMPITEARASSGVVTSKKADTTSGTQIDVAGPSGQFRLTWQSTSGDAPAFTSVLNAIGAIHITVDGRGVRSDAHLTVRSYGGAFDQFRIRLPHGAALIRDPAAATGQEGKYRVSVEPQAAGSKKAAGSADQVVLVELKEKQQGPVSVDLSTEQPGHDPAKDIEFGGFEILGAVRQFGDVALTVANDWQARWNTGRDIRQVDPTELDTSLERSDITAAFQYDRQPWSLPVRVSPRASRVHVTPQYDLDLRPEEARLNVHLVYQNFGARTYGFVVDIDGWELSGEPIESGGLIDQDRVDVANGKLRLPFSQASSRKAEVTFSLRHPLDRGASNIKLPLPIPQADSVAIGTLSVRAPADVELLPDLTQSTGLTAGAADDSTSAPTADAPAELHFRCLLPKTVFVVNRTNRSREESAQIAAKADFVGDSIQVDERIDYLVRFEPVKELILEAPSDYPIDDQVEVAIASPGSGSDSPEQRTPLHVEPIMEENEFAGIGTQRFRVTLSQPQVGKFAIAARYQIANPQPSSAGGALQVPLLSPVDARIVGQRASVRGPIGVSLSLGANADASSWRTSGAARTKNGGPGYEFETDRAEPLLPLLVSTADSNSPSTTIVDRVWLQTWIAQGIEQDRSAFHIRSSNLQATVELPPDAPTSEVEVLVDGKPAQVTSKAAGRLVVKLITDAVNEPSANATEPTAHTLEVRFRRPIQQSLLTRYRLTPPQVDASTELSQVYWQVVLPGDVHIIDSPPQLAPASQWQWLGSFWGQHPLMAQSDLENWSGATPQIGPAQTDNEYLFSGLLPVSSIELVTAPRWFIVLAASSLALLLVAGCYYLPNRARSWSLAALGCIILATTVAYPTAAALLAQASAIGLVLAILAVFVTRLFANPAPRMITPAVTPSTRRVLTPRTDSIIMPPVASAASTAPTVTLRTSDSER